MKPTITSNIKDSTGGTNNVSSVAKDVAPTAAGASANTILAAGKKQEAEQVNAIFNPDDFSLVCSKINNTAPFNSFTSAFNNSLGGTVLNSKTNSYQEYRLSGIILPKITTTNYYYMIKSGNNKGKVQGASAYSTSYIKNNYLRNGKYSHNYNMTPDMFVLPNCVGAMRARYQQLQQKYAWSIPSKDPNGYKNTAPFSLGGLNSNKTPKANNVEIASGFWLWKDTNGTYGPKDGLWGCYKSTTGAPPLPGCLVVWDDATHVAFCEALYNYGTKNEYIITTESALGQFNSWTSGYLYLVQRKKYTSSSNLYSYHGNKDTYFLYTPLCNYEALDSLQYNSEGEPDSPDTVYTPIKIVFNSEGSVDPEVYNKMVQYLKDPGFGITVGSKVEIQWDGNTKSDGSGTNVHRIFMTGYVRKIYDSGLQFPYEVVDKASNGRLIGFYDKRSLKLRG